MECKKKIMIPAEKNVDREEYIIPKKYRTVYSKQNKNIVFDNNSSDDKRNTYSGF